MAEGVCVTMTLLPGPIGYLMSCGIDISCVKRFGCVSIDVAVDVHFFMVIVPLLILYF